MDSGQALFQLAQGLMAFNAASKACPDESTLLGVSSGRFLSFFFPRMAFYGFDGALGDSTPFFCVCFFGSWGVVGN